MTWTRRLLWTSFAMGIAGASYLLLTQSNSASRPGTINAATVDTKTADFREDRVASPTRSAEAITPEAFDRAARALDTIRDTSQLKRSNPETAPRAAPDPAREEDARRAIEHIGMHLRQETEEELRSCWATLSPGEITFLYEFKNDGAQNWVLRERDEVEVMNSTLSEEDLELAWSCMRDAIVGMSMPHYESDTHDAPSHSIYWRWNVPVDL